MNRIDFLNIVKPLSITNEERIYKLYDELEYIRINNIGGDLVECGVYRGGNILGMMKYCEFFNLDKTIWLYDTFAGMTKPEDIDIDYKNNKASDMLESIKCYSSINQVKKNLSACSYKNIRYVVGDVCETLRYSNNIPHNISLLRLDTDWFESTKCELEILFPKLVDKGSLIIDDYGHWKGCKLAVDDYFKNSSYNFNRIDYTAISLRK